MAPIDKKILFVCKETYSYPLFYLAEKWKKNNKVAAFFFNPIETMLHKCLFNDTTYYNFKKDKDVEVYTSNKIADIFTQNKADPPIDYKYLEIIEKKYTNFRNLNGQIISSQYFTRHYHYRNYMAPCTYKQQMYWLELNYKNILGIIDKFKPDYIIDCDTAELARLILLEVSYINNIPYLSIEKPRYDMYRTITFNLGLKNDDYFLQQYKKNYQLSDGELRDELEYIEQFKKQTTIMSKEFKVDNTSNYNSENFISLLRRIHGIVHYFFIDQDLKARNLCIKTRNPILYGNTLESIKFNIRRDYRRNKLLKHNKYFENPVEGEKYVYMPLHLIPEATTFVKAPFYINELYIIEAVSKALPIGWYLYVKEHPAMVGERGVDFYEKVKKLPNVKMVQMNYYNDPKPWIMHSQGVITITGTTAFEAAVLGKRAIVFGEVLFNLIDEVTKVNSIEKLPELIQKFSEPVYSPHSCAAYIKTVKDLGVNINLLKLLDEGLHLIREKKELPNDYYKELHKLEQLYLKFLV